MRRGDRFVAFDLAGPALGLNHSLATPHPRVETHSAINSAWTHKSTEPSRPYPAVTAPTSEIRYQVATRTTTGSRSEIEGLLYVRYSLTYKGIQRGAGGARTHDPGIMSPLL